MDTSPHQLAISIVIVSFNTCELLRACLESLHACTLPFAVVVVDNGSRDDSVAMVCSDFPEVVLLEPEHNAGFGGGNNLGMRALGVLDTEDKGRTTKARFDAPFVLLLNPDTVVHAGAIESLAAFLEAHPRVGVAAPRLLNPDGSLQPAAFRFPTLSMALLDLFPPGEVLPGRLYGSWWHGRYAQEGQKAEGERQKVEGSELESQETEGSPFPIDHPLGACMLVRHEVLAQVGGFDERYFMYSEEIDLCWRIRQAGWAIWQVPEARVTHYGGAATRQFRQRMFVELYRSRAQFAAQHYSSIYNRAQRVIVRAGMLRLTLRAWRAYAAARIDRDELRARLWGYACVMRET